MNPFIIIGGLGVLAWLALGKKTTTPTQTTAEVKLPTSTQPGSVNVSLPTTSPSGAKPGPAPTVLSPPTVVQIPETVIRAGPANTSILLTPEEMNILDGGTNDQIYDAATNSSHVSFVATSGLVLSGRGDSRGPELSTLALTLGQV